MSSSGVEKRGSFLGEYPTPRQLLGNHKPASESTGASLSSGSWLSGVRASFRGKSSHQPKIKSSGSNLYVPGSQPAGSRVSLLLHHSPAAIAAAFAAAAAAAGSSRSSTSKRSQSHTGPPAAAAAAAAAAADFFAVPAPPPPLFQHGSGGGGGGCILDSLASDATACGHLHVSDHQHDGSGGCECEATSRKTKKMDRALKKKKTL